MAKLPQLSALTFTGFYVNSAIESGNGDKVSFSEIYKSLENGTLFELLYREMPGEFDFSLFKSDPAETEAIHRALFDASAGFGGRERRKAGVESSGLHILMACILEAIQRGTWVSQRVSAPSAG
jgi:hypothetical protein